MMLRRSRRTVPLVAALAFAAVAVPAQGAALKPNMTMVPPYQVQMTTDGSGASFVAFGAAISNKGPGILKVEGLLNPGSNPAQMDAKQILMTTNDLNTAHVDSEVDHVGTLQFSPSASHNHWHYLHFENYQLLSVPNLDFVAPTRKTGFCLSGLNKGAYCAGGNPNATQIGWNDNSGGNPNPSTSAMGIMPQGAPMTSNQSSSDDYDPTIEGQDIEITNVPNGRYCLSFTVNPDNKIVETNYADNGSSTFVDVGGTPGGTRTLSQPVDSEGDPVGFSSSSTCGLTKPIGGGGSGGSGSGSGGGNGSGSGGGTTAKVKALTRRMAAKLTRRALKTQLRHSPSGLTGVCRTHGKSKAVCKVSFSSAKAKYSGSVTITQKVRAGQLRWYYKISVKRVRRGACAASGKCPTRVRTKTTFGGVLGAKASSKAAVRAAGYSARRLPTRQDAAWPAWYLLKLNNTPTPLAPLPLPPVR
jgi:hypothetical protein